jgi:hypothetical protein
MFYLSDPELIVKILTRCGFPNVNGGDGEIEKEEEHIRVRNKDYAELGSLIDIDEPEKKKLKPSKSSLQKMANEKDVQEQKSNVIVLDARRTSHKVAK